MNTQTTSRIVGYGPANLLSNLKMRIWKPFPRGGLEFCNIILGGHCIINTPTKGYDTEYKITVRNEDSGDSPFTLKGYSHSSMMNSFSLGSNILIRHRLSNEKQDGQMFYSVTLEVIQAGSVKKTKDKKETITIVIQAPEWNDKERENWLKFKKWIENKGCKWTQGMGGHLISFTPISND